MSHTDEIVIVKSKLKFYMAFIFYALLFVGFPILALIWGSGKGVIVTSAVVLIADLYFFGKVWLDGHDEKIILNNNTIRMTSWKRAIHSDEIADIYLIDPGDNFLETHMHIIFKVPLEPFKIRPRIRDFGKKPDRALINIMMFSGRSVDNAKIIFRYFNRDIKWREY